VIDESKLYGQIASQLKEERANKKISQDRVAEALGMSRTSVINFEKGTQRISLHLLYMYCELLSLSIHELLPSVSDVTAVSSESFDLAKEKLKESPTTRAVLEKYRK